MSATELTGLAADLRIDTAREDPPASELIGIFSAIEMLMAAAIWAQVCLDEQTLFERAHLLRSLKRQRFTRDALDMRVPYRAVLRSVLTLDATQSAPATVVAAEWAHTLWSKTPLARVDDVRSAARAARLATWLREELEHLPFNSEPETSSQPLFDWLRVTRIEEQSPVRIELTIAGGAAMASGGLVPAIGAAGLAPVVFFGFARATVALWQQVSQARLDASDAYGAERMREVIAARADADMARERLREELYNATRASIADGKISRDVVDLVVETALPGARLLASTPAVDELELTRHSDV